MIPHGSDSSYTYHGCRCEDCREAHAEKLRKWQRERFGFSPLVPAGTSRTMLSCLVAFGVQPGKIGSAMGKAHRGKPRIRTRRVRTSTEEGLGRLHWGLFISHAPFRQHCRCGAPSWVADELEAA